MLSSIFETTFIYIKCLQMIVARVSMVFCLINILTGVTKITICAVTFQQWNFYISKYLVCLEINLKNIPNSDIIATEIVPDTDNSEHLT